MTATKALQNNDAKNETAAKELNQFIGRFRMLQSVLQESEMLPTTQLIRSVKEAKDDFEKLIKR